MKKIYSFLFLLIGFTSTNPTNAQPLSATQLNWDYLDFLPSANTNYTGWYASAAVPFVQHFAMGPRRLTFTMSNTNLVLNGENNSNTAHAGSVATDGDDVQFTTTTTSTRTIRIDFDTAVHTSVIFALFDIDNSQRVTISALNDLGANMTVVITRANAASGIIIGGTPTARTATGPAATDYASNNNNGTVNVSIAGRVKQITIALDNAAGDVFLSDLNTFVVDTWVNNWRNISRPFNGVGGFPNMPGYIITVVNKRIVMLDPATGRAKDIFTDPSSYSNNLNGFCYDPVFRKIYYTYSLSTSPWNTKVIVRYNVDTEIRDTLIANVNTIGIPTYRIGLESGSASFYNGALYYGVEGTSVDNATGNLNYGGREHTVWRIDFNAVNVPYRSTQVYSTKTDSLSGSGAYIMKHDWSDIAVTNNNMLYDFDGARGDSTFFHYNLLTGQRTQHNAAGNGHHYPKQTAVDWAENVYNMGDSLRSIPSKGFIVPYNYNGTVNSSQLRTVTINGAIVTGSWGDCGEAYRPLCDFGDAPASYDPDPWSPAVHERDINLRLGATFDREWNKTSSIDCTADGSDEDGISYVPVLAPGYNMGTIVSVYNNTGRPAYLQAWVDMDGNGTFDSDEACAFSTVNSMATQQSIALVWLSAQTATATLPNSSYTYMRIRLIPSDPYSPPPVYPANYVFPATGYFDGGETEDYRTIVDNYPLAINLISFDAIKESSMSAKIAWSASENATTVEYGIERSGDGTSWEKINSTASDNLAGTKSYTIYDIQPLPGLNFYRLVINEASGEKKYSSVRSVLFTKLSKEIVLAPNPARDRFNISLNNNQPNTLIQIKVAAMNGNLLFEQKSMANTGFNTYSIPISAGWAKGMYMVYISRGDEMVVKKLIVN